MKKKKQWSMPKMESLSNEELKKVVFASACSGYAGCGFRAR